MTNLLLSIILTISFIVNVAIGVKLLELKGSKTSLNQFRNYCFTLWISVPAFAISLILFDYNQFLSSYQCKVWLIVFGLTILFSNVNLYKKENKEL